MYLIHMSLLKTRRRRLLQCALAYVTPYSMHMISSKIILFKVDVWCISGIMKNQMAPRLLFFLPFSSQNLLWLTTIVLFLLDISVCWRARKRIPNVYRTRLLYNCDWALTKDQYNEVILSLQTSSSVRRPDVCQPGMDVNHKIAIFRATIPSLMMQHK